MGLTLLAMQAVYTFLSFHFYKTRQEGLQLLRNLTVSTVFQNFLRLLMHLLQYSYSRQTTTSMRVASCLTIGKLSKFPLYNGVMMLSNQYAVESKIQQCLTTPAKYLIMGNISAANVRSEGNRNMTAFEGL